MLRTAAALTVSAVVVGLCITPAAAGPGDGSTRHSSGVRLLGAVPTPPPPMSESAARQMHELQNLAFAHPNEFGYPSYDRASGRVVANTVVPKGRQLLQSLRQSAGEGVASAVGERTVRYTVADLERIKNSAIELTAADLPDGDAIVMTEPDPAANRIVITVRRVSDGLLQGLAERYGADTIAVRVEAAGSIQSDSRNNDRSPFYGGAKFDYPHVCTSGFSWRNGTTNMMLTAGHCVPTNGEGVYTPGDYYMGSVAYDNWTPGTGTVLLSGDATYRGDIGLVKVTSSKSSAATIYRGGPGSSASASVRERWSRRAQAGDRYCTGGHVTGEICGWTVASTGLNIRYDGGETVRNVVRSEYKGGTCTTGGDSGGPVYTVRSDGGIAAKGIHSGTQKDLLGCKEIFTDIYEAYYGFPGDVARS